jgi:hypothetical protein
MRMITRGLLGRRRRRRCVFIVGSSVKELVAHPVAGGEGEGERGCLYVECVCFGFASPSLSLDGPNVSSLPLINIDNAKRR